MHSHTLAALFFLTTPVTAQTMETGFLNRTVVVEGVAYPYQVYVPRDYDASRDWPVILFLHGAGERGTDGLLQTEVGLLSAVRRTPERWPAIIVAPQAPVDSIWQGAPAQAAMQALDRTIRELRTDPSRVYLTGLSMGGNGAWYLAYHNPDRFAALAVVCGFVTPIRDYYRPFVEDGPGTPFERVARAVRHLPIRIVHGDADPVVDIAESRSMHAALVAAEAEVQYRELPGVGHNAWDPAYGDPDFALWLFAQRR